MAGGQAGAAQGRKAPSRQSDKVARQRQALPWVRLDKQYRFETDEGSASLADLFRGRSQLLVYHFTFGDGDGLTKTRLGCTGCAFVTDHFDGVIPRETIEIPAEQSAWAHGEAMSVDQAVAHALGRDVDSKEHAP